MEGLLGLLVNPVAGMGGRVGLHGTDGQERLAEARRRGAVPVSGLRTVRALRRLGPSAGIEVLAAPGPMGIDAAAACGVEARPLDLRLGSEGETTVADTEVAARLLAAAGVDLLLFAGGDGTARDVLGAVGLGLPLLGIPSGVKMHSGVFASSPEAAGDLACDYLARPGRRCSTAEVLDAAGDSIFATEFHGVATVPRLGDGRLVGAKSSSLLATRAVLDALCEAVAAEVAAEVAADTLYLFGPGTTTRRILELLGLRVTPLGINAVLDGKLVGEDLSEDGILKLMESVPATRLVLGVIGGQGFLLGRGNQQLGPRVLARLCPRDLCIVSAAEKLISLDPPALWVDAGDEAAFRWLVGYHRVRVAPDRYMMMRVAATA